MNATEDAIARHPSGKASPASVEVPDVPDTLTAADRCDAGCGAGALYRLASTALQADHALDLCHHHAHKYGGAMDTWTIIGQNLSLMKELYASNRLVGADHA